MSPAIQIYDAAFTRTDFGLASAWGVSMLVALAAFSILYVLFTREDLKN
jgi:ABC-type sugar transport system permease subunit